jgi:hypothetical protein
MEHAAGLQRARHPCNRPEDQAAEAFYEAVYDRPELQGLTDKQKESLMDWLWREFCETRATAYRDGQSDGPMLWRWRLSAGLRRHVGHWGGPFTPLQFSGLCCGRAGPGACQPWGRLIL